jgi:hypothetical protein
LAEYKEQADGRIQLHRQHIHKYDQNGNLIGNLLYDSNNALIWSEELNLDEQGRIRSIQQVQYDQAQKKHSIVYEYDQYGNRAVMKTFAEEEQQSEQRRVYSLEGELLESYDWMYLSQDGKMVKKIIRTINEYDSKGQLLKSVSDIQEGKRKTREIRHFRNNFLTGLQRFESGKLVSQFEVPQRDTANSSQYFIEPPLPHQEPPMEYDDLKRDPLAKIPYTNFREIQIKTDKQGNHIKKVVREYNQIVSVTEYSYDKNGNLAKEHKTNKQDGTEEITVYQYDQYNNMTKEAIYRNDVVIAEKNISYEYY